MNLTVIDAESEQMHARTEKGVNIISQEGILLDYVRYACLLQSVFHPYPSPDLQLDAQDESTSLSILVTDIPFVPVQPG